MNCYFEKKRSEGISDVIPFDKVVKIEYINDSNIMSIFATKERTMTLYYYNKETKADANKQVDNYKRWLNITLNPKSNLISF